MDSTQQNTFKRQAFFDKSVWIKNKFAWFYAVIIALFVVVYGVILKLSGIYESMALRIVNVFFILGGFILLIRDYEQSKKEILTFIEAFGFCVRTGFHFALLFLPILFIFLLGDKSELSIILAKETLNTKYPIEEMMVSNYIQTFAAVAIMSYVAAITAGIRKPKKNHIS